MRGRGAETGLGARGKPRGSTLQGRAGDRKIRGESNLKGGTNRGGDEGLEGTSGGGGKEVAGRERWH